MFPFSDDEVLLVEGFLVSNHGDFEELPYIYNYKTNKITEIKLKVCSHCGHFIITIRIQVRLLSDMITDYMKQSLQSKGISII